MENLVRETIIILCICLSYGVAKYNSSFPRIKRKTTRPPADIDDDKQMFDVAIVPSNLTAYDLYIPVIKRFEVVIGHPCGFNITFYAETKRWILVEFHGNVDEYKNIDEENAIFGVCYRKKVNQTHARHYFEERVTPLKAGNTVYFFLYVTDPFCTTKIIRNGRFRIR